MGSPTPSPRIAWLVNLYGDPEAQHAHAAALLRPLARQLGATVVPIYCLDEDAPSLRDLAPADRVPAAHSALSALLTQLALPAAPPVVVSAGDQTPQRVMATAIAAAIQSQDAILALVHTHGYNAVERFFLGSFSERFSEHTPCPLLVVTPDAVVASSYERVVFATDLSEQSRTTLHRAIPLLRALGCSVQLEHLITVHELPLFAQGDASRVQYHDELRAAHSRADEVLRTFMLSLEAAGVPVTCHVERITASAVPGEGLVARAHAHGASMIVVAAHGDLKRPGGLGSSTRWLMRHADVPVLVMPAAHRG